MLHCVFIYLLEDQFYYHFFLSYASFMYINDADFSFGKNETPKICCGKCEPYNVDVHIFWGSLTPTVCYEPSKHIN